MKVRGLIPTEFMYTTMLMAANRGAYSDDIFVELISLLSKGDKKAGGWDGDDTLMKVSELRKRVFGTTMGSALILPFLSAINTCFPS